MDRGHSFSSVCGWCHWIPEIPDGIETLSPNNRGLLRNPCRALFLTLCTNYISTRVYILYCRSRERKHSSSRSIGGRLLSSIHSVRCPSSLLCARIFLRCRSYWCRVVVGTKSTGLVPPPRPSIASEWRRRNKALGTRNVLHGRGTKLIEKQWMDPHILHVRGTHTERGTAPRRTDCCCRTLPPLLRDITDHDAYCSRH